MSTSKLPELPDDVRALLAAAAPPEPPSGLEEQLLATLSSETSALATAGVASWGATTAKASLTSGSVLGKWGAVSTGIALVVGTVGGAGLHAALAPRPEPTVIAVPVAPLSVPEERVAPPTAPVQERLTGGPPPKPLRRKGPEQQVASSKAASALEQERHLLETARSALLRREPRLALPLLERHRSTFPGGVLEEERDALFIQSWVSANEPAKASEALESFRRKYPKSPLLPALEKTR